MNPPARRPSGSPHKWLIGLASLCSLVGCSSYESKWQAAASRPASPGSMEGRWEGTWTSDANGHTGSLRCVMTRTGDDAYHADYHATFWKVFRYSYDMPLRAELRGDKTYFVGDADLGWLAGGTYHYEGDADAEAFRCEYKSKYDFGTFRLHRPADPTSPSSGPTTQSSSAE